MQQQTKYIDATEPVQNSAMPSQVQCKLAIGAVNDPLEAEADAMADRVMRMPEPFADNTVIRHTSNSLQRKCAHCEEEETARRKPMASFIQKKVSGEGSKVSDTISQQINSSRGSGSCMDSSTQSFMESRFGTDFSNINIHTGSEAVQLSRELNAQAFTVGNDIYFNEGKYNPSSDSGKYLLAHELTHTVQQGVGVQGKIQRRLAVSRPRRRRGRPSTTNAAIIQNYLTELCPTGAPTVDSSTGHISIAPTFCMANSEKVNGLSQAQASSTPVGCGCLCDMVNSSNAWSIVIDDRAWPNTVFNDDSRADGIVAGGSGGVVKVPSPLSSRQYGAVTASGGFSTTIPPWLILGHELCGHAWMGNSGNHASDSISPRGRGGHQSTVARENLLRDEHHIERRGTFRQPYCGESYSFSQGTIPSSSTVTFSRYLATCQTWRNEYNSLNRKNFTIADDIPVVLGELLPP